MNKMATEKIIYDPVQEVDERNIRSSREMSEVISRHYQGMKKNVHDSMILSNTLYLPISQIGVYANVDLYLEKEGFKLEMEIVEGEKPKEFWVNGKQKVEAIFPDRLGLNNVNKNVKEGLEKIAKELKN